MSDLTRAEAIAELSNILPQTPALRLAIDSLKAYSTIKEAYDRGYKDGQEALAVHLELCKEEQEPCEDCIKIPEGATNGDMIKAMFPNVEIYTDVINEIVDVEICEDRSELRCFVDWWDSPYRKEQE